MSIPQGLIQGPLPFPPGAAGALPDTVMDATVPSGEGMSFLLVLEGSAATDAWPGKPARLLPEPDPEPDAGAGSDVMALPTGTAQAVFEIRAMIAMPACPAACAPALASAAPVDLAPIASDGSSGLPMGGFEPDYDAATLPLTGTAPQDRRANHADDHLAQGGAISQGNPEVPTAVATVPPPVAAPPGPGLTRAGAETAPVAGPAPLKALPDPSRTALQVTSTNAPQTAAEAASDIPATPAAGSNVQVATEGAAALTTPADTATTGAQCTPHAPDLERIHPASVPVMAPQALALPVAAPALPQDGKALPAPRDRGRMAEAVYRGVSLADAPRRDALAQVATTSASAIPAPVSAPSTGVAAAPVAPTNTPSTLVPPTPDTRNAAVPVVFAFRGAGGFDAPAAEGTTDGPSGTRTPGPTAPLIAPPGLQASAVEAPALQPADPFTRMSPPDGLPLWPDAAGDAAPLSLPPHSGVALAAAPQGAPVPVSQLASAVIAVIAAMPASGSTETRLTLAPAELGQLSLQITTEGDAVLVTFTAERPETLDLLRRHADQLLADLRQSGVGNATLAFGGWGGARQQGDAPQSADPTDGAAGSGPVAAPAARHRAQAPGGLDLRL